MTQAKLSFSKVESQYKMPKTEKLKLTLNMLFRRTKVSNKGNSQKITKKLLLGKENGLG